MSHTEIMLVCVIVTLSCACAILLAAVLILKGQRDAARNDHADERHFAERWKEKCNDAHKRLALIAEVVADYRTGGKS